MDLSLPSRAPREVRTGASQRRSSFVAAAAAFRHACVPNDVAPSGPHDDEECTALADALADCPGAALVVDACERGEDTAPVLEAACAGKADRYGNRALAEPCTWDWQCDHPLVCRPAPSRGSRDESLCLEPALAAPSELWADYDADRGGVGAAHACDEDGDCASETCRATEGYCVIAESRAICVGAADGTAHCRSALGPHAYCFAGLVCDRSELCRRDSSCGPDEHCDQASGRCLRDSMPEGTCFVHSECDAGEICVGADWHRYAGRCERVSR